MYEYKTKINTKKQDNGLYGTPFNCKEIEGIPPFNYDLEVLSSALIIHFDEKHSRRFHVKYKDNGLFVEIVDERYHGIKLFHINYDSFILEDDILYFYLKKENKIKHERKLKIKMLLNNQINKIETKTNG